MHESTENRPPDGQPSAESSLSLLYVGIALLAFGLLVWRMATTPLAGGDADEPGLILVGMLALIAGLAIAVTGLVRWAMDRQRAQQRRQEETPSE